MAYVIRPLVFEDYTNGHLELYKQLTSINPESISQDQYKSFVSSLDTNHCVFVATLSGQIVGTITIIIEQKLIHNMGKVGHIEDVVVDSSQRGKGLGSLLVQHAVDYSNSNGCYKTILDCNVDKVEFYKKCGFEQKGCMMTLYQTI
jgi:glucosamine-phosphate N-acetyltransferase